MSNKKVNEEIIENAAEILVDEILDSNYDQNVVRIYWRSSDGHITVDPYDVELGDGHELKKLGSYHYYLHLFNDVIDFDRDDWVEKWAKLAKEELIKDIKEAINN